MQDVAVVPLVLMVTMLSGSGSLGEFGWRSLEVLGVIVALVVGFYLITNILLPRLLKLLSLSRDRELLVVLAVILALGSASAAHAFGISPALGAFVAGMMLAESPYATQIRVDIGALRALFLTLFFTTVGMLGDPAWIAVHIGPVLLVVLLLVVGKATIVTLIARLFKVPLRHAVATGITLAQVGEFGLVIGGIAQSNGLLEEYPFRLVVSATLLTLFLTPIQVRVALKLGSFVEQLLSGRSPSESPLADEEGGKGSVPDILVAGFGPAGQGVVRALAEQGESVLVLDLRPANIDLARSLGYEAVLGDASNLDLLLHHGVTRVSVIVVTVPDHRAAAQIVGSVRILAPRVQIVARARYHYSVAELREAGADLIVDEEGIMGRRLTAGVRAILQKIRTN
jgi:CPA2 family monovalent cation:H+ antiporter-2